MAKKAPKKKASKKPVKKVLKKKVAKRASAKKPLRKKAAVKVKKVKITQEQISALLKKGQERGFLTTSEILYALPNIEDDVIGLEKVYDELKERGVEVKDVREFLQVKGKKEKKPK